MFHFIEKKCISISEFSAYQLKLYVYIGFPIENLHYQEMKEDREIVKITEELIY